MSTLNGFTNYTIEYGFFETDKNEEADITELKNDRSASIEFRQSYNGRNENDYVYFQIDTSELDEWYYILYVNVSDTNSDKTFFRQRKIRLIE